MAHKVRINGTVYEITGGRTRVSGATYNISKGLTRVNGTACGIEFLKTVPEGMIAIIMETWFAPCGKVTVNGEGLSVNVDGVYAYEPGTMVAITPYSANIYLDGVKVQDQSNYDNYSFALTSDTKIYAVYGNGAEIRIETE